MRPVSHTLFSFMPALFAVFLVFLSATPLEGGSISYTPNIAWLMTLLLAANTRYSWPRGFAFALGLLQDLLFGTPLGAQALLTLLLAQWIQAQHVRGSTPLQFHMRWIEATGTFVAWHALLWLILQAVDHSSPPLTAMLLLGVINGLWYPLFYVVLRHEELAS